MPQSKVFQELRANNKGYYGDPCHDSLFGSTASECEDATPGITLAHAVLSNYGLSIADGADWAGGPNATCCPLDILNQDPFACIKMSLMSSLMDEEYWECYADEWGEASFIQVLPEGNNIATLPRVQYCVPSMQPADIADLVIVRSADPPPFRKCGKVKGGLEWYEVLDGSASSIRAAASQGFLFPGGGAHNDARGMMFSWGEVTGFASQGIDPTCEIGRFDQYGTIVYPDYERKQIYNDGVVDLFELQGFEQILFWLVDVDYGLSDDALRHYSIQFVKSTDIPVQLANPSVSDSYKEYFGPVCDISETGEGTGSTPNISIYPDPASEQAAKDKSCTSVQSSISAANERQKLVAAWGEYLVPSFFTYGGTRTRINFNDTSKWMGGVGTDECIDEAVDNMYESTTELWGNGCPLEHWSWSTFLDTTYVNVGQQKGHRTLQLPQGSVWTEAEEEDGYIKYALRAEAPSKASVKFGGNPWINPFDNHMLQPIASSSPGNASSVFGSTFQFAGYLFGWDDGLYTIDSGELWAKIKIARPGIAIQGFGKSATTLMGQISLRVKPVYQVDFPAALASQGEPRNAPNYQPGCVDLYEDLKYDKAYCEPLEEGPSNAEMIQESMTGSTIDITIPFLFPDFLGSGQTKPSEVVNKTAFDSVCAKCNTVALFVWDYVKKYKDEPNKGYSFVCGPPSSQAEVPKLGQSVETEHGIRTINSISYSYSDGSSFNVNIEAGPISLATAHAGSFARKRTRNEDVKGKVVDVGEGALYKVDVPGIGVIQAWNIDKYPWDVGDKVTVSLYNHPAEL